MSTLAREDPREVVRSGVRRVLWTTLGLNIVVSASKIAVGHLAGSLSLVADGYHSLIDGSNNVIGFAVVDTAGLGLMVVCPLPDLGATTAGLVA